MTALVQARNPRSGLFDYQRLATGPAKLDRAEQRARRAQMGWRARSPEWRADCLLRLSQACRAASSDLVESLFQDTGRWTESELEVEAAIATIERWARHGPEHLRWSPRKAANVAMIEVEQGARPYPLIGVISPWNFPLLLSLIDAVPALMAGCAVMVKPSEVTPRFIEMVERIQQAVPELADLLIWCVGDGRVGRALIERVDLVCFTGSVATGRQVGELAASRFIPAFLELGGKDAALVLDDANPERTARALVWGGMVNAGQSCMSIERVYAVDAVYERLLAALDERIGRLCLNTPDPRRGQIGPVIAAAQIEVLGRHLEDADRKGARFVRGGRLEQHDGGTWCQPTLLADVDHSMLVMREETFGPILPVMPVADEEQAIALANDSDYGLSAAVFSADFDRARRLAGRVEAGAISINDAALTSLIHTGEKQSFKLSGLGGSRMGPASIHRFVRQQCFLINPGVDDPWWFD